MQIPNIYFPNLGLAFSIDSIAFYAAGIPIYWYSLIMMGAIASGTALSCWIGRKEDIASEIILDYVLTALPFSIIGARFYYVIFHWHYYQRHWQQIVNIRQGGIAIYGAVIAALITAVFYTRKRKVAFLQFADIGVIGLVLGQAIGRYGNFVNKEAFGYGTDSLFAMGILKSEAKAVMTKQIIEAEVTYPQFGYYVYLQVHPTFLYESCWNLLLFAFLLWFRKRRCYQGMLFFMYLVGYGIGRFWVEGFRTDQLLIWGTDWPISQAVALVSIIMGIIGIYVCRMERNRIKK